MFGQPNLGSWGPKNLRHGTGYNIPVSLSQATDMLNQIEDDLAVNVNFGGGSLFGASSPGQSSTPNTVATASTSEGGNAAAESGVGAVAGNDSGATGIPNFLKYIVAAVVGVAIFITVKHKKL